MSNLQVSRAEKSVLYFAEDWPLQVSRAERSVLYGAEILEVSRAERSVLYLEVPPGIPLPFGASEESGTAPTLTQTTISFPFGASEEDGTPPVFVGKLTLPFGPSEEAGFPPTVKGITIALPFGPSEEQGFPPALRSQAIFLPFGPSEEQGWPPLLVQVCSFYFDTLRDFHFPVIPGHSLPDWDHPGWSGSTASPIVLKVYTDNPRTGAPTVIPMPLFGKPIRWEVTFGSPGSQTLTLSLPGIFDIDGDKIENSEAFGGRLVVTVQRSSLASTVTLTIWTQNLAGDAVPVQQVTLTELLETVIQEGLFYKGLAFTLESDSAESCVLTGAIQS